MPFEPLKRVKRFVLGGRLNPNPFPEKPALKKASAAKEKIHSGTFRGKFAIPSRLPQEIKTKFLKQFLRQAKSVQP
jgi:hypothetical protein